MSSGGQRAVSRAMLEEVKERERLAEAQVTARQTALEKAGLDKELQRLSSELTQLQGRSSALRQVSICPSISLAQYNLTRHMVTAHICHGCTCHLGSSLHHRKGSGLRLMLTRAPGYACAAKMLMLRKQSLILSSRVIRASWRAS